MSVIDWFCSNCGSQGTAVALKPGEEFHRVQISHRYISNAKRTLNGRSNVCRGNSIRYAARHDEAQTAAKGQS